MTGQSPDPAPRRRRLDPIPVIVLVALVLLLVAGLWLFPRMQAYIAFQDCVASGRPNCQ